MRCYKIETKGIVAILICIHVNTRECAGRDRKTWRKGVKDDIEELDLHTEWVVSRDKWRDLISRKTSDPS